MTENYLTDRRPDVTDDIVRRLQVVPSCWCDEPLSRWDSQAERYEAAGEIERLRGLISQMVDAYDLRMDGAISADDYLAVLDLLREEARCD